ncbi:hypothetical protein KVV02_005875 [Mortierella alpina]|uniref:C2H2-type domain-containing protein n=1 Tax=Mortierella alpina TaxID=64518 RepID=A0A9P7ZWP9_MORAP|nr:hypothetical protein KVV02_005875 [Mortierella alpina]
MWEMSSGSTRPYREHTPDGMIYCILNGILEEYPNDTPKIYAACIRMCWTLAPDDRPAAKDVLPDIESLSRGHDAQETQELRSARNSDFDSSTGSIGVQDLDPNALNDSSQANISAPQQQSTSGQAITYHYFCNFPECDYHSARSDPVKRHRDTHYLDYKPYICTYCHSSSARRDSTREHCLKVHKDDSETAFRYDTTVPKPEGWIAYKPKRSPWPPIIV